VVFYLQWVAKSKPGIARGYKTGSPKGFQLKLIKDLKIISLKEWYFMLAPRFLRLLFSLIVLSFSLLIYMHRENRE
jgi:hypothetical protein